MKTTGLFLLLFTAALMGFSQQSSLENTKDELKKDTLFAKRIFTWTNVYQNGEKLSNSAIKNLLNHDSQASKKYAWGKALQPVGPLVVIGGVALMTNGLIGKQMSAVIDGVTYDYTDRSLTKTLLGLATTALGICLIESSNELIQHSTTIYNKTVLYPKAKVTYRWGVLPEGNLGFAMNF